MTNELWQKSACELAEGIARRQFSCREVMASVADAGVRIAPGGGRLEASAG